MKPCRWLRPPTGPISPAAKNPATPPGAERLPHGARRRGRRVAEQRRPAAVAGEQQRAVDGSSAASRNRASRSRQVLVGGRRRRAPGSCTVRPTSTRSPTTSRRARSSTPTTPRTRKSPRPCSSAYSSMAMPSCSPRRASRLVLGGRSASDLLELASSAGTPASSSSTLPSAAVTVIGRADRPAALADHGAARRRAAEQDADGAAVVQHCRRRAAGSSRGRAARWRGRRRAAGREQRRRQPARRSRRPGRCRGRPAARRRGRRRRAPACPTTAIDLRRCAAPRGGTSAAHVRQAGRPDADREAAARRRGRRRCTPRRAAADDRAPRRCSCAGALAGGGRPSSGSAPQTKTQARSGRVRPAAASASARRRLGGPHQVGVDGEAVAAADPGVTAILPIPAVRRSHPRKAADTDVAVEGDARTAPPPPPSATLRASGHEHRRSRPRSATTCSPGCGPASPVSRASSASTTPSCPQLERALLAGHDLVLLGERGQGKTRLIRTLVDAARRVDAGRRGLRDQRPSRTRRSARAAAGWPPSSATTCRSGWKHRSERYGEKLATPDTSVGDLIGDVDPIKVAEGRTLGDPETVHYGLVPRTNRGIFAVNELPDLAERIQVSLLNVLEERDIQVRGYALRLPLDLLLVASANPEDYTNRGRIITPLKDRFGAEIRTHYPLALDDELDADPAGGRTCVGRRVPDHLIEVVARFTRHVRESPAVDARSGVSARFAVAAAETAAASALRRVGAHRRGRRRSPGSATCRRRAHAARQGRVRGQRGGPRDRGARAPAAPGRRPRRSGATSAASDLTALIERFDEGCSVESGDLVPGRRAARAGRPVPGPGAGASTGSASTRRRVPGLAAARWSSPWRASTSTAGSPRTTARPAASCLRELPDEGCLVPRGYRYGSWHDGPDPLAPPYDVRRALDEIGDAVLAGATPRDALRDLLRRGTGTARAVSTTCCAEIREQRRELREQRPARRHPGARYAGCSTRRSGRSGPRCSPTRPTTPGCARPSSTRCPTTPRARSASSTPTTGARPRRAQTFEQMQDLLRREVLDTQFRGMKRGAGEPRPGGDAAGQGHDGRPQRDARRGRAGRAHPGGLRRVHGEVRRHVPGQPAEPRGAGRLARPPGRRGRADDALAVGRSSARSSPT